MNPPDGLEFEAVLRIVEQENDMDIDPTDITDPMMMGCELYTRMGNGHWELVAPFGNTEEALQHGRKMQETRPELAIRVKNDDDEETAFEDSIGR